MKVKIGNTIYDSENEPIMIILSDFEIGALKKARGANYSFVAAPNGYPIKKINEFSIVRTTDYNQLSTEEKKKLDKEILKYISGGVDIVDGVIKQIEKGANEGYVPNEVTIEQEPQHCCHLECEYDAEFELKYSDDLENNTYMCSEHVIEYLSDKDTTQVTPI